MHGGKWVSEHLSLMLQTILVFEYWVLGDICRYSVVLVSRDTFISHLIADTDRSWHCPQSCMSNASSAAAASRRQCKRGSADKLQLYSGQRT